MRSFRDAFEIEYRMYSNRLLKKDETANFAAQHVLTDEKAVLHRMICLVLAAIPSPQHDNRRNNLMKMIVEIIFPKDVATGGLNFAGGRA